MGEQAAKGYVLVKVVNFLDSVFDTDQISVFRGGSELARWLPYHLLGISYRADAGGIKEPYKTAAKLKALSLGGSQGLYEVDDAEAVAQCIAEHLRTHPSYRYLSIEVAGVQAGTLQKALPILRAKVAWQQMQSHRIRPDFVTDASEVCALTGVRAAGQIRAGFRDRDGDKLLAASPSVIQRLQFGRRLRKNGLLLQSVSQAQLDVFDHYQLSDDFEEIAGKSPDGELGKIAYLYWDGNSFGKLNGQAEQSGKLVEWDRYLRKKRAELMTEIIESAEGLQLLGGPVTDPETGGLEANKKLFRLEPLLWGGDESLLVMPAAAAVPVLNFIQLLTRDWQYCFDSNEKDSKALTHAYGLLICSAKTPVREARSMAANLAELGKKSENGRSQDSWTFAALSSIDYDPTGDMNNYLISRFGETLAPAFHGLRFCHNNNGLAEAFKCINGLVSRGQLRRMAGSVVASRERLVAEDNFAWKRLQKELGDQTEPVEAVVQRLSTALFESSPENTSAFDGAVWALLEELYDYRPILAPEPTESAHESA